MTPVLTAYFVVGIASYHLLALFCLIWHQKGHLTGILPVITVITVK